MVLIACLQRFAPCVLLDYAAAVTVEPALLDVLRCPVCRARVYERDASVGCTRCGREYAVEESIPRMLDASFPGMDEKLAEVASWPALARAEGWYEPDDDVDAHLPFLCRDLGWDEPTWRANEHSFQLLLDDHVRSGLRVLEVGAAKCWAAQHLVPRGCWYVGTDILADPNIGLGRGRFFEAQVGRFGRVQADGERLPFADGAFDLTYCVAALHHALDLRAMVGEMARVTRRGGTVAALNEGTRAPLRGGESPDQAHERTFGINEHTHSLWGYLGAFVRAGLVPRRVEHAEGPSALADRRIAGRLLRLPGGRLWATLWAQNAYAFSGVTIFATKARS